MGATADIGVFGGSGFYKFLDDVKEVNVETPYGAPSDKISLAEVGGRKIAFLPRHGRHHAIPPHKINYRANVYAMKSLGVTRIVGPCAAGSLQKHVKPGEFVICDQFVDRTSARIDTFYDGPIATHIGAADPYCAQMRSVAASSARELGIQTHETGTMVVIQGPRFSTRAESKWFGSQGWQVINMTGYPEGILAREQEMCYCDISLITDYDVGVDGLEPVSHEEVIKVFNSNVERIRKLISKLISDLPAERTCGCKDALKSARLAE